MFIGKNEKDTLSYYNPKFIYCKARRHENEYIKLMYVDVPESFICTRDLITAQTSIVKMDAELDSRMAVTVSDLLFVICFFVLSVTELS